MYAELDDLTVEEIILKYIFLAINRENKGKVNDLKNVWKSECVGTYTLCIHIYYYKSLNICA